ncbi:DDE family transposase [Thiocapsa rosea]|uniref:DDE family transposase n=1 Tax=Thiocapsa rosea TaxID=69360 RepID=A0A495VG86_9GAMM|nr:DDE family transposase [Thiocapsa rosea]
MSHFRPILRDVDFLRPLSVQNWLPEGHLARYVVEVVAGLDLGALEPAYPGRGSLPYHPAMLLSLLIYGYATGSYSGRTIDHEAQLAARAAEAAATGRKPGGKPPNAPTPGPSPEDQMSLTDEKSRIMPVAGGGLEPCCNAQAVVDSETMPVLLPQVMQAANDRKQLAPMLEQLQALPKEITRAEEALADAGYFSKANVTACESAGIEPAVAIKRDAHHPHWSERFESPQAPPAEATPVYRMAHRLKSAKGRATSALRKQTVEPVFGIIKSVMGFSSGPHPRSGKRPRRVDPGVPGVELKAHGRIASR